jgi:hypothetical protein
LISEKRLPIPCPVPTFTPIVEKAILGQNVTGNLRIRLQCEAAMFYYGRYITAIKMFQNMANLNIHCTSQAHSWLCLLSI